MSAHFSSQSAMHQGGSLWTMFACMGVLLIGSIQMSEPLQPADDFAAPRYVQPANYVQHDKPVGDAANKASMLSDPTISHDGQPARLFGMETEPVASGAILEKWTSVKADLAQEFETLARCRANGPCPAAAQRLIDISATGAHRSGRARVGLINRAVDLAISPVSDETQWGIPDHWSAPFETLQSNRGDCEDYAIVKYAALLEAGLSEDDVKIVIVRNVLPDEDHAEVAARVDGRWLILDNRTLTLVRDTDVTRAIPEYVLDREGVRRFIRSGRNRQANGQT
jgi:predicted transglutaminase-like cysteine proteinase